MITNPFEEIKERLNIEDVLSEYVELKQNGVNFKCICPFHQEKTPSMVISPQKKIWHCFGCGLGGDVFAFVERIENIEKKLVLQKLASKAGVKLESSFNKTNNLVSDQDTEHLVLKKNTLQKGYEILNWTAELYHQILLRLLQDTNHPVSKYCLKRGLTVEVIKKFKLGWTLNQDILCEYADKNPNIKKQLIDVGLIKE